MVEASRQKNWTAVINMENEQKENDNRALFLSGMAKMELKNFDGAIRAFESILDRNK
jgi:hypothetical protein